ncbi:MAG: hypothetical protein RLZZ519_2506 [Bacteroidota bacterium]|jgi:hypothetical protein
MKKRTILTLGLLFFVTIVNAQTIELDFKYGLKLSNAMRSYPQDNVLQLDTNNHIVAISSGRTTDWFHLVPAFLWQTKRGDFSELSIGEWQVINEKTERVDTLNGVTKGANTTVKFGLAYGYSIRFLKNKTTKFLPLLGFEFMPYFHYNRQSPVASTAFPTNSKAIGLQTTLQPHLMWLPTKRLFFDVGLTMVLMDGKFVKDRNENPIIPIEQQTVSEVNFEGFPGQVGFRIGAGVRL